LSAKQQKAIAALMTCRTARAAAKQAQIGERELYRWLQDAAFQAELKRAGQEAIDAAIRRLATLTGTAIDTLQWQMNAKNTTPSVKVRAADIVLARLLNLKELSDLEARITHLEKITGAKNEHGEN
jgi:hypothetical protein